MEQLGSENDKGVVTPGVSGDNEEDVEDDTPLVGKAITRYRGAIARCNYMEKPTGLTACLRSDECSHYWVAATIIPDWSIFEEISPIGVGVCRPVRAS